VEAPRRMRSISASRKRREFYAISLIAVVMIVGTLGFRAIEGMNWVDAFYFESMLATGQGPPIQLTTDAGKIFASIMAFVSVGSVITSLVFTLVPIISQFWREGLERVEAEARTLEKDMSGKKKPEE
jgi:voltage-gated potassium channel